jgi:hypothetical protein
MEPLETYFARAEALGAYYAKKRIPPCDWGWVNVLNDCDYHPIYGRGDDEWVSELNVQMNLHGICTRAYLDERHRLKQARKEAAVRGQV